MAVVGLVVAGLAVVGLVVAGLAVVALVVEGLVVVVFTVVVFVVFVVFDALAAFVVVAFLGSAFTVDGLVVVALLRLVTAIIDSWIHGTLRIQLLEFIFKSFHSAYIVLHIRVNTWNILFAAV